MKAISLVIAVHGSISVLGEALLVVGADQQPIMHSSRVVSCVKRD
jgi:hypothetical protein